MSDGIEVRHSKDKDVAAQGEKKTLLALRPERLAVILPDEAKADLNRIEGHVQTSAFVGSQYIYVVETPLGTLESQMPAFEAGPLRHPGARVAVTWSPEAGVLVKDR